MNNKNVVAIIGIIVVLIAGWFIYQSTMANSGAENPEDTMMEEQTGDELMEQEETMMEDESIESESMMQDETIIEEDESMMKEDTMMEDESTTMEKEDTMMEQ